MPLDLPPHHDAGSLWLPPKPAIIRPADHSILRPGYFQPVDRAERRAIIAELVRGRRLTREEARKASFLVPVVGFRGHNGVDAYTKLLLHFEGADASTTFTDSAPSPHTVTAHGNAQIDTAQFKFGAASGLFDGSGDYLTLASSADFGFGTGDFTIDCWFRFASTGTHTLYTMGSTSGQLKMQLNGSNLRIVRQGVGAVITGTATISTGTWYHFECSRASGSTKMFVNGSQDGSTYSDSNDYGASAAPFIGSSSTPDEYMDGWIDELMGSKGIARHTTTFTPKAQAYY